MPIHYPFLTSYYSDYMGTNNISDVDLDPHSFGSVDPEV